MTVAAVILAASAEEALQPIDGQPAVRRLADLAWSGGALPIIVVAPDPDGRVGAALTGASANLVPPPARPHANSQGGDGAGHHRVAELLHGWDVAGREIRETDGALAWPAAHVWVSPETVTSLIEAHGVAPEVMVVPTWDGDPGWPILLPVAALEALRALPVERPVGDAVAHLGSTGFAAWPVALGDPGAVLDAATARDALPGYQGPPGPVSGRIHEWGDDVSATDADAPA